ncbi:MAG: hypothetical protein ACIAS6_10650 [Phycisphaerales bacterium JB060]
MTRSPVTRSQTARRVLISGLLLATGGSLLAGCGSSGRHTYLRWNVAPELETLDQRWVDADNEYAIMNSENTRMLRADWRKVWYVDRPSRLSREPKPY